MRLAVIGSNPAYVREGHYASGKCVDVNGILTRYVSDYEDVTCTTILKPGIDTIFGYLAIQEKLPLCVIIPYFGFADHWDKLDKTLYTELLGYNRIETIILNEGFTQQQKLQAAYSYLINNSDVTIVISNQQDLAYYRNYSKMTGKEIITIPDNT